MYVFVRVSVGGVYIYMCMCERMEYWLDGKIIYMFKVDCCLHAFIGGWVGWCDIVKKSYIINIGMYK